MHQYLHEPRYGIPGRGQFFSEPVHRYKDNKLTVSNIFSAKLTGTESLTQSLAGVRVKASLERPWEANHSSTASKLSG